MNQTGFGHFTFHVQNKSYIEVIERNGIDKGPSTMTATVEMKRINIIMHRQKILVYYLQMQYQQM
jgi:hypothetical protein